MLKKYAFVNALIYTLALTIMSLIKVKGLPDMGISNSDKIFHFLAYAILIFLWYKVFFYKVNLKKNKAIIYAGIISIIFGIIIELIQGSATTSRVSDVYDGLANVLGVLFMSVILLINKKTHIKKI